MDIREAIGKYSRWGLSLIPIAYKTKKPLVDWKPYQSRRPTQEEQVEWWDKYWSNGNEANIGIVCGRVSGNLVVLDFDYENQWADFLRWWDENRKDNIYEQTPVVRTGRGYQVYLQTTKTITNHRLIGVDVKGEGGYVVAPPSIHPSGKQYGFINPDIDQILQVNDLSEVGINLQQSKSSRAQDWVSEALEGVHEGQRDDTCTRLAGYFLKQGIPRDVIKTILYGFAQRCEQPPGSPFGKKDVDKTVDSVWRKESTKRKHPIGVSNNTNTNIPPDTANSLESEQEGEQLGTTSSAKWGEYAGRFDEIMREGGDWQDKRDIAEQIGISHKDRAYRNLLQRRREDGRIRVHGRNPYLIQWVNRDYRVTQLSSAENQTFLDIKLPLNLHQVAQIPPGSVIGLAGYVSSGKTSFLLETAELNVFNQPMPVYYFYNEMSEAKMAIRCQDFPLLIQAQKQNKFFPVKQSNFEFADVIEPDAINLIDYLDRDDELYLIGSDIKRLQARLNNGIVIFALQKKHGEKFGYGGLPSAKLSNLYIALDTKSQDAKSMRGEAQVIKAKDWADSNPVGMYCPYHSGGKHGKLFADGEWQRS